MLTFTLRRLGYGLLVLLVVTFMLTVMLDLVPGSPAAHFLGDNATQEQLDRINLQLGIDKPVHERYFDWVTSAIQGDLGEGFRGGIPVIDTILEKLPVTLQLVLMSQVIAVTLAILTGLYTSNRPGGLLDRFLTGFSQIILGVPNFVLGLLLLLLVAVHLRWLPISGYQPVGDGLVQNLRFMALPVLAVASEPFAIYWRVLRADLSRTLREDFILMAEAKGLSPSRILFRHALRPSMFSVTTLAGITTAKLIGTTLIIEQIFALPGIGRLLIDSVIAHDYPVILGTVTMIAVIFVVTNTIVDLLYSVLDPRIQIRGAH